MRIKPIATAILAFSMAACDNDMEQLISSSTQEMTEETTALSRSSEESLSDSIGTLIPYIPTEEEIEQIKIIESLRAKKSLSRISSENYDRFLSSNLEAIKDLPFNIKVYSIASNSTSGYNYLYATGKNKEMYLSNKSTDKGSLFYLVYPVFAFGYGPQIFSSLTNTELCVGINTKNPERKYLMPGPDNSSDISSIKTYWNFIPTQHNGYFYFECKSTVEQDNNSNFYYKVIEALSRNCIGFAKRIDNKSQQEFMIALKDGFQFSNVEFDTENAVITDGPLFVAAKKTVVNEYSYKLPTTLDFSATTYETSQFVENPCAIQFNLLNVASVKLPRPIVVSRRAVIDIAPKDAVYLPSIIKKYSKTVNYSTGITLKPNSSLELTCKFHTYNIEVPYVAVAKLNEREVKMSGVWKGYVLANPTQVPPILEPHFYDLETGAEIQ